jgi:hypothetical protein
VLPAFLNSSIASISVAKRGGCSRCDAACQRDVDTDFFGHFEDKDARVLESPLNVWHGEVRFCRKVRAIDVNLYGHGYVVRRTMERELSGDLNLRVT